MKKFFVPASAPPKTSSGRSEGSDGSNSKGFLSVWGKSDTKQPPPKQNPLTQNPSNNDLQSFGSGSELGAGNYEDENQHTARSLLDTFLEEQQRQHHKKSRSLDQIFVQNHPPAESIPMKPLNLPENQQQQQYPKSNLNQLFDRGQAGANAAGSSSNNQRPAASAITNEEEAPHRDTTFPGVSSSAMGATGPIFGATGANGGNGNGGESSDHVMVQMSEEFGQEVENFLMQLSSCYQLYGCPIHVIEINMPSVARGLGIQADFTVFPTFQLVCFKRLSEQGKIKKNTQFFPTSHGTNVYKLQLVDELVRRISSYATSEPPRKLKDKKETGAGGGAGSVGATKSAAARANASMIRSESLTRLLAQVMDIEQGMDDPDAISSPPILSPPTQRPQIVEWGEKFQKQDSSKSFISKRSIEEQEDIKKKILNIAAYGPGILSSYTPIDPSTTDTGSNQIPQAVTAETMKSGTFNGSRRKESKGSIQQQQNAARLYKTFARIAVEDAAQHLHDIIDAQPLYRRELRWLFNALGSAGCCGLFFGGNWIDMFISLIMGFIIAVLGTLTSSAPNFSRIYEMLSAFIVSFVAWIIHSFIYPLCYKSVAYASVVWLLQGVAITLAIVEITRKMISGTIKLFYGITVSAIIGFGLDIGTSLSAKVLGVQKAEILQESACSSDHGVDRRFYPLLLLITIVSFNFLINAHAKQLFPMVFIPASCYLVSYFTGPVFGKNAGAAAAAFAASLISSAYSRWSGNPAIIYMIASLLMLVPGSLAVSGFFTVLQQDITGGLGIVIDVLMVALSLSMGLFLGSLLILSDEQLRWLKRWHLIENNRLFKNKRAAPKNRHETDDSPKKSTLMF